MTKPAQIGNGIFNTGVPERFVIERAQREYEYQNTTEAEATRKQSLGKLIDDIHAADTPAQQVMVPRDMLDQCRDMIVLFGKETSRASDNRDAVAMVARIDLLTSTQHASHQPAQQVMVPVEPTEEMLLAGTRVGFFRSSAIKIWAAMLQAAQDGAAGREGR